MYELRNAEGAVLMLDTSIVYDKHYQGWQGVSSDKVILDTAKAYQLVTVAVPTVEFQLMFTLAEQIVIEAQRQTDAKIKRAFALLDQTPTVNIRLPFVQELVTYILNLIKTDASLNYTQEQADARIAAILKL